MLLEPVYIAIELVEIVLLSLSSFLDRRNEGLKDFPNPSIGSFARFQTTSLNIEDPLCVLSDQSVDSIGIMLHIAKNLGENDQDDYKDDRNHDESTLDGF